MPLGPGTDAIPEGRLGPPRTASSSALTFANSACLDFSFACRRSRSAFSDTTAFLASRFSVANVDTLLRQLVLNPFHLGDRLGVRLADPLHELHARDQVLEARGPHKHLEGLKAIAAIDRDGVTAELRTRRREFLLGLGDLLVGLLDLEFDLVEAPVGLVPLVAGFLGLALEPLELCLQLLGALTRRRGRSSLSPANRGTRQDRQH